ncbi:MAG TPA: hypothetical protein ENH19_00520 [Actinobacteria bacterium]|nr:hypothetical protein [Actinomycetes bacterium]HEX21119.1 hypothetical protein [Actinomycetota bacterium]
MLILPGLAAGASLQQQIDNVDSQINSKKNQQSETKTKSEDLNKRLEEIITKYQASYSELATTESEIAKNQRELNSAIGQQAYYQKILNKRSVFAYRYGNVYILEILLQTTDFQDFISRLDFLSKISTRDAQVLRAAKRLKTEIKDKRNKLDKQKLHQAELVNLLANNKDEMSKTLAGQQELLTVLNTDINSLSSDKQKLIEDKKAEDERLAQWAASGRSSGGSGHINDNTYGGANPSSSPLNMIFPLARGYAHGYSNDWGAARPGGSRHQGTDIFASRGTPVVAVTNGVIGSMFGQQKLGGFRMWVNGDDGYNYYYAHLNGDVGIAYAPGIAPGVRVSQGQVIGYVGNSGQAKTTPTHTHFGITINGMWINPYPYLRAADWR